jgi:hypothetical protein
VPDAWRYESCNQVDRMSRPGAAMCTVLAPKFENDVRESVRSTAASLMTFGSL